MSSEGLEACAQALKDSSRVALATHVNPDADGLGSALALGLALRSLGKQVQLLLPAPPPESLAFLPLKDLLGPIEGPYDLAVALDCPEIARTGPLAAQLQACPRLMAIDHHPSPHPFGTLRFIDPKAAATGELVYALLQSLGLEVKGAMAQGLYAALAEDTGSFKYSNTSPHTHRLAAQLIEAGVRPYDIAQQLFDAYTPTSLALLSGALARIQTWDDGRLAMAVLDKALFESCGASDESADGIINYLRGLRGVQAAAVLRESAGGHRLSLRSRGGLDVAAVARRFGGGGHAAAAGATLTGSLDEAAALVRQALSQALAQPKP